jgi:hypothetical protein
VPRMTFHHIIITMFLISFSVSANASRGAKKEDPAPQIYKDSARSLLESLVTEPIVSNESPFTNLQQEELKNAMRDRDGFLYDQPKSLVISNPTIKMSLMSQQTIVVNLGHTYHTSIIFTDALGNPWPIETLADVSNSKTVSVNKSVPHILSVKPLTLSGQTNLPVKLDGEQFSTMILFNINEEKVDFNVDVRVDGLGTHPDSQRKKTMGRYLSGERVPPKLNQDPAKELMLQMLTPEGYARRELIDDYGDRVDPRDFTAWSYGGKLYIMTPHQHYTPEPIDVSAASDGRHRLLEYEDTPFVLVRKNSQLLTLLVK